MSHWTEEITLDVRVLWGVNTASPAEGADRGHPWCLADPLRTPCGPPADPLRTPCGPPSAALKRRSSVRRRRGNGGAYTWSVYVPLGGDGGRGGVGVAGWAARAGDLSPEGSPLPCRPAGLSRVRLGRILDSSWVDWDSSCSLGCLLNRFGRSTIWIESEFSLINPGF